MDCGIVRYCILQGPQACSVVTPWNPELEIATASVFLFQMGDSPFDVPFAIEVRIMSESELDRAEDDRISVYHAVCFRYNLSVDAAWSRFAGSAMIFCSLCYQLDLVLSEPFL